MARMTKAQREWRPGMPKKRRSIRVTFASTVLMLEAFVVLFAALASFGLHKDIIPQPVILTAGVLLAAALVFTCALLRRPLGYWIGWILQLVILLTGLIEPMMFLVGALFGTTWWYAVTKGRLIDLENAGRDREQAEWERLHPDETPGAGQ